MIRSAAFPRRKRAQEWMGSSVRESLSLLLLASVWGSEVCVCGCGGDARAPRGDAVRDGPMWLQRHGWLFREWA